MRSLAACLAGLLVLGSVSACRTTVDSPDGYTVRVEDRNAPPPHGDGRFCPPGQAKKGHC